MTKIIKPILFILLALCALALVLIFLFLSIRAFNSSRIKAQSRITSKAGIEELLEVSLNGTKQWIYIRGEDRGNPVLLLSQDGYMPMIFRARDFSYKTGLEKHFTVVTWDKRGEGKAYLPQVTPDFLDNNELTRDILELTLYLKKRFRKEKIYLAGHSGGSESGILAASRYGEHFYAYIGIGQVTNNKANAVRTYNTVIQNAKDNSTIKSALEELGPPPYDTVEQMFLFFDIVMQQHGLYYSDEMTKNSRKEFMNSLLSSPEYTIKDVLFFMSDPMRTIKIKLEPSYYFGKDFSKKVTACDIPLYFIQGTHDISTTGAELELFLSQVESEKEKKIVYFEKSGHYPCYEEPENFLEAMVRIKQDTL